MNKNKVFKVILNVLLVFCFSQAFAINVESYYPNANKDYLKYFMTKLFSDEEFSFPESSERSLKNFKTIFAAWIDQLEYWSFSKEGLKVYYLNLNYKLENNKRTLTSLTLFFKSADDTLGFTEVVPKGIAFKNNSKLIGFKFNSRLELIGVVQIMDEKSLSSCVGAESLKEKLGLVTHTVLGCEYLVYSLESEHKKTLKSNFTKEVSEHRTYQSFPNYLFIKKTDPFSFYFKRWRIPIETLVFRDAKPIGFVVP